MDYPVDPYSHPYPQNQVYYSQRAENNLNYPYNGLNGQTNQLTAQDSQNNYQSSYPQQNYDPNYILNYNQPYAPSKPNQTLNDTLPHPIDVNYKDWQNYADSTFDTSECGIVPPPVFITSVSYNGCKYYLISDKNCSPNFIRSTLYSIPKTAEIYKKCSIPLSLIITPFSNFQNNEIPLIDNREHDPVRCNRCRAYVNSYSQFLNGGKSFKCNICEYLNETPEYYFCNLDQMGMRLDISQRPELVYGSYDTLVSSKYCRDSNANVIPIFVFLIDVSFQAVSSGLVKHICSTLTSAINSGLFDRMRINVGIIAYDSHLYVFSPKDHGPEIQIVLGTSQPFLHSPAFAVDPIKDKDKLLMTLNKLPEIFETNKTVEVCLGSIIEGIVTSLSSLKSCVKLFIFHSTLPTAKGSGKLTHVENRTKLGGPNDKEVLLPQIPFYSKIAEQCILEGIGIDLYLFPSGHSEIATLAPLSTITGGCMRLYRYFKVSSHGNIFSNDLLKSLRDYVGMDASAKLRVSTGLSAIKMFGSIQQNTGPDFFDAGGIDPEKSYCVELNYDHNLSDMVHFQFAILYTSASGQRLLRVHNLACSVTSEAVQVFKGSDQDSLVHYFFKRACQNYVEIGFSGVRQRLITDVSKIFASYRKTCASSQTSEKIILPNRLTLLPLYINSILNSEAISGGQEMPPDEKVYALCFGLYSSLTLTCVFLSPRLFDIYSLVEAYREINSCFEGYSCEYCTPDGIIQVRGSYDRLNQSRVYLLENGINIFIWFGKYVDVSIFSILFGVDSGEQYIGVVLDHMPSVDSDLSRNLSILINQIRKLRNRFMRIFVCQQDHKSEYFFKRFLSEDKGPSSFSSSYVELLCLIHNEINKELTT